MRERDSPIAGFIFVCLFLVVMYCLGMVLYGLLGLVLPEFLVAVIGGVVLVPTAIVVWANLDR
jgi:hypothetical protein